MEKLLEERGWISLVQLYAPHSKSEWWIKAVPQSLFTHSMQYFSDVASVVYLFVLALIFILLFMQLPRIFFLPLTRIFSHAPSLSDVLSPASPNTLLLPFYFIYSIVMWLCLFSSVCISFPSPQNLHCMQYTKWKIKTHSWSISIAQTNFELDWAHKLTQKKLSGIREILYGKWL